MSTHKIEQVIQAIKNFEIKQLYELLDDNISYMNVTKSLFLKTLKKKFKSAYKDDCYSFDDVYFGICGSCNKGCEGMTFLSESGYYLDLYIESKDGKKIDDIYICNDLTNFTNLHKINDLGFSFCKDEEVTFEPSKEYLIIKQQCSLLLSEIASFKDKIKLEDLLEWYSGFNYTRGVIDQLEPLECFDYKLYNKVFNLTCRIDRITNIHSKSEQATEALINYQLATSEREKLIWFFENHQNHYGTIYFKFPKNWKVNSCVIYKANNVELIIDITGYEYVMDYFIKIDEFYDELMEKYKPLPEHFEQSENGGIEYSVENYLRLHNKHLDVVKMYDREIN
jgi:hypothetical protein